MTNVVPRLPGVLRRLARGLRVSSSGWWGLATGPDGMVAAHVVAGPDGRLSLDRVQTLSAGGAHPARRAADVAIALSQPRADCALLLPTDDYRIAFIPGLPVAAHERREALRWRMKDEFDFPADDAVIDCVTAQVSYQGSEHGLWMVVAARSQRVTELVSPLTRAGIPIEAVDVAELAQRNLAARLAPPERTVAMLTMDTQRGLLTVSRDDGVLAARHFDPLAAALTAADDERRPALLDRLALELQRTFDNVGRQYNAGPIERVLVMSETVQQEMIDSLRSSLTSPVEALALADVCTGGDAATLATANANRTACLAVGAALRAADGGAR